MELALNEIIVSDRQRYDYGDVQQLADSIAKIGLLHPIVVTLDYRLIAGGRRLKAFELLGRTHIPVRFHGHQDIEHIQLKEMELEENVSRKDLTEVELARARTELHALRSLQATEEGYKAQTIEKTAEESGISKSTLSQDMMVMRAVATMPELANETSKVAIVAKFRQEILKRLYAEKARRASGKAKAMVRLGEMPHALAQLDDGSVQLIVTDPPFGVDIRTAQLAERITGMKDETVYADKYDDILAMLLPTCKELYRVLADGCHMYMFCSVLQFHALYKACEDIGFRVDPMPLIWSKGKGINFASTTRWTHTYEMCLFASKGQAKTFTTPTITDIFVYGPPSNKRHIAEKPIALLKELIEYSSVPGDTVLDCFCGSGSTLVAALECQRSCIGFDINPVCVELSTARVEDALVSPFCSDNEQNGDEREINGNITTDIGECDSAENPASRPA